MANMLNDFVKRHEAAGRAVFIKPLDFYLDSLDKFDYTQIIAALDEEI